MWRTRAGTEGVVAASLAGSQPPAAAPEVGKTIGPQIFGFGASDIPAVWSVAGSLPLHLAAATRMPGLLAFIFV